SPQESGTAQSGVNGIWFGGLNNFAMKDVNIRNSASFSMILSNGSNAYLSNVNSIWDWPHDASFNLAPYNTNSYGHQDGIHLWDWDNLTAVDCSSNGDDDAIA